MNKRLQALQKARLATIAAMEGILNTAETRGEGALLTAEEQATYDKHATDLKATNDQIGREQALIEAQRGAPVITDVEDRASKKPFASLGEQLLAVHRAHTGGEVDPRLFGAASGASASVGADGGFMIQKDFATDLFSKGEESSELASRCSSTEIGPNSDGLEVVTLDDYDKSGGAGWGGVQVYRRGEADTVAATKPKFDGWAARLEDLMGLAYATERLLQDAPAMGSVFQEAFREQFGFKLDDEIFRGTGVGQCQGLLSADATIVQAKEGGQTADTITAANVQAMWSRVHGKSRKNAVWFYNQEAEVQLQNMQIGTGSAATLVFLPPGGLADTPYGRIFGRPAIPLEHASALGDKGDISVFDLTQYKIIRKGAIEAAESIHVRFVYAERAFRWITRVNGKPKWKKALTPYKGAITRSPFVTLAERA